MVNVNRSLVSVEEGFYQAGKCSGFGNDDEKVGSSYDEVRLDKDGE